MRKPAPRIQRLATAPDSARAQRRGQRKLQLTRQSAEGVSCRYPISESGGNSELSEVTTMLLALATIVSRVNHSTSRSESPSTFTGAQSARGLTIASGPQSASDVEC